MSHKFQKILVAGGAGFIGSHIVDKLLKADFKVIVFDNLSTGRLENLEQHKLNKNFNFVKGDIRKIEQVEAALKGVDAVFNDAAVVSVRLSLDNPLLVNEVNVNGALNLLKASVDCGVKRFVQASSASIYGNVKTLPVTEDTLPNPISPYAVSELAADTYARVFNHVYGLETVCLRYFNVYGPRQSYSEYSGALTIFTNKLLNNQPLTIFGDGEQTRDFVYVEDIAEANLLALKKKEAAGKVFNIATGKTTSVNTLANKLLKIMNKTNLELLHKEARPGEIRHSCASIEKARRVLGYKPMFTVDKGLRNLVDWYTEKSADRAREST